MKIKDEREDGYYWVKVDKEDKDFIIARKIHCNTWTLSMFPMPVPDDFFAEIDENRIPDRVSRREYAVFANIGDGVEQLSIWFNNIKSAIDYRNQKFIQDQYYHPYIAERKFDENGQHL